VGGRAGKATRAPRAAAPPRGRQAAQREARDFRNRSAGLALRLRGERRGKRQFAPALACPKAARPRHGQISNVGKGNAGNTPASRERGRRRTRQDQIPRWPEGRL